MDAYQQVQLLSSEQEMPLFDSSKIAGPIFILDVNIASNSTQIIPLEIYEQDDVEQVV